MGLYIQFAIGSVISYIAFAILITYAGTSPLALILQSVLSISLMT